MPLDENGPKVYDLIDRMIEKAGIDPETPIKDLSGQEQAEAVAIQLLARSIPTSDQPNYSLVHNPNDPTALVRDFLESDSADNVRWAGYL